MFPGRRVGVESFAEPGAQGRVFGDACVNGDYKYVPGGSDVEVPVQGKTLTDMERWLAAWVNTLIATKLHSTRVVSCWSRSRRDSVSMRRNRVVAGRM